MDATYVNPALHAILNILDKMAHIMPERGDIKLKINHMAYGDVTSIIEMEGESGIGSVAVSFPQNVIRFIAERMLPPGMPLSDEMLQDLTGELSNMIAGSMKGELEQAGLKYNISLPKILTGTPHVLSHNCKSPIIMLSFNTEAGPFYVEVAFQDKVGRTN